MADEHVEDGRQEPHSYAGKGARPRRMPSDGTSCLLYYLYTHPSPIGNANSFRCSYTLSFVNGCYGLPRSQRATSHLGVVHDELA